MASKLKIKVNGLVHNVTASLDTPLLYVLHNELHLHGPRFGCGLAQCGACSVLLDGKEIRSCVTPVAAVSGKAITTLEGLPALWAKERGLTASTPQLHPIQQAWIEIHPDNTVTIRTGKADVGNGTAIAYRQVVAEELNVPVESITKMYMGSTDTSVDGGTNGGVNSAANLRKVAAYMFQALLGLASTKLGVPVG